jgi:hypothetical protein
MWRTKEGEEVDFLLENGKGDWLAFDAKLSIHGADPVSLPPALAKTIPQIKHMILVTYNPKKVWLSKHCLQLPLEELTNFLLEWD